MRIYRRWRNNLPTTPMLATLMTGTGGLRKMRFAPPSWHTGKSGAARVCYAVFPDFGRVYFVAIFGKNEQANLAKAERNRVAILLRNLSQALQGRSAL